jgi:transposase InsO family protein
MKTENKSRLARQMGVSRSFLYYEHKQAKKDWALKCEIEKVLRKFPSYGHKRLADHLKINKKRTLRVMKLFGIKPYRRRTKKWRKSKEKTGLKLPNLLITNFPAYPNHIWASDFTHIDFKGKWVYLATVIDLFTRQIVGFSIMLNHSNQLVINALLNVVSKHPIAEIIHSDQGSEYTSKDYTTLCANLAIQQSMSNPGCPWENGYQESFYDKFKIDLGDSNRFENLGELIYEIYRTIYIYNNERIHSKLRMSPVQFEQQYQLTKVINKCV